MNLRDEWTQALHELRCSTTLHERDAWLEKWIPTANVKQPTSLIGRLYTALECESANRAEDLEDQHKEWERANRAEATETGLRSLLKDAEADNARLREHVAALRDAARLKRNVMLASPSRHIRLEGCYGGVKTLEGEWVAVPEEDFENLRRVLAETDWHAADAKLVDGQGRDTGPEESET